ncbi:tape measure protein [Fibrella sp. WM1]|uniref:tape measure protein n=1 Tax=Fibrella musci TaxID=3242485 RepID=UPI003520FF3C
MNYEFLFKLRDLISPALMQVQGRFDGVLGRMRNGMSRFQGMISRSATTIGQLRDKLMGLGSANRTIDGLNKRLDELTKRRDVTTSWSGLRTLNRQIEQTEKKLERMRSVGRTDGEKGWFGNMMGKAAPFLGAAALGAGAISFAQSGMDREQTKVAFEQFVGKQGVDPLMGQLNKFADVTPYSNEDVYGSARTLLSAKVNPAQLNSVMTQIGNMAAVSQKDFGELSAAYGKILQKGFIDGGELHQEFGGTALMDQLKKTLKVDGEGLFKMAEKRQIRAADVATAIENLSEKGELYSGGLDKLSQTAGGKWSTFLGTLENKFATWAEGLNPMLGKLFDFGTDLLSKIDPMLEKLQPVFAVIRDGMMQVWDATAPLRDLFGQLWDVIVNLFAAFGNLTGGASGLSTVFDILSAVVWTISTALKYVGQLVLWLADSWIVKLIGVVWLCVRAWSALNVAMAANPIGLTVVALAALIAGLKYAWDHVEGFRRAILTLWEVAKSIFSRLGQLMLAGMTMDIPKIISLVADAWKEGTAKGGAAYRADHEERFGKLADRRAGRNKRLAEVNPTGVGAAAGKGAAGAAGGGGTVGDKAGLSATTGGTKSTTVNIHLEALVKGLTMNVADAKVGVEELKNMVIDELTRVLAGSQAAAQ